MTTLGKRTTAEQALRGASLAGKTAIVTGASSGLGVETVRVLAAAGANVVLAVRNVAAGEATAEGLRRALGAGAGTLRVEALDLADLGSVRAFVQRLVQAGAPVHLLVNNAGVMATPQGTTKQGLETQVGTNHVGHFVLTTGLLPLLQAGAPARIVTVSSSLHTRGRGARLLETLEADPTYAQRRYVPFDAYGDSKLANILFTQALTKRLPSGVQAFCLHPGVIPTPLSRDLGFSGVLFRLFGGPFMKTVPQGAATSVYAATAPELEGKSGAYLADCQLATPSADARDAALAERVWAATEQRARA